MYYYKRCKLLITKETIKETFQESCKRGKYDIALWLYNLLVNEYEISNQNINEAFCGSFKNDNFQLINWLYRIIILLIQTNKL